MARSVSRAKRGHGPERVGGVDGDQAPAAGVAEDDAEHRRRGRCAVSDDRHRELELVPEQVGMPWGPTSSPTW